MANQSAGWRWAGPGGGAGAEEGRTDGTRPPLGARSPLAPRSEPARPDPRHGRRRGTPRLLPPHARPHRAHAAAADPALLQPPGG